MIGMAVVLALLWFVFKESLALWILAGDLRKWLRLRRRGSSVAFLAFVEDDTRGRWG